MLKFKFAALVGAVLLSTSALASEGSYNKSHKGGDSDKLFAGLGFNHFYGKVAGTYGNRDSSGTGADKGKGKAKFNPGFSLSVGVGAHLTENLRVDLTLGEHFSKGSKSFMNFTKSVNGAGTAVGSGNSGTGAGKSGNTGTNVITATLATKVKQSAFNPMLNFSYDIDTGHAVKPYVTAGVGLAFHSVKLVNPSEVLANETNGGNTTSSSQGTASTITSAITSSIKKKTSFAYALGLGASYEVSEKVFLDLGYKFLNLGKAADINYTVTGTNNTNTVNGTGGVDISSKQKFSLKSIKSSTVEVGIRFAL